VNHENRNRDLDQLLGSVRASLRAGHCPPDPETQAEFQAFKREFPEERWRWEPTVEIRVGLLGEMLPPFKGDWKERHDATMLSDPVRHGRVLAHVIAIANQERSHE
jgi:hypothetical protein